MLRLHITPPAGPPFEHRLEGEALVVGRSLDCDLPLADAFLSRQHARLLRDGDGWTIEDLGSRNGTRVNGESIRGRRRLATGDRIEISACLLEMRSDQATGAPPPSPRPTDSGLGDATYFRSAAEMLRDEASHTGIGEGSDELLRWAERLQVVNDVHHDLGQTVELDELVERLLDRVFDHLQPERGVIYLRRPDGELRLVAHRSGGGSGEELLHSTSLLREVADKGLAALVLDARTDERFSAAQSMLDFGVRSLVAAPLLDGESSLGMIALDSRLQVREFSQHDMALLVSLASAAALRIRNLALTEEAAERRRLQGELDLARRIQVALLQEELPAPDGWRLHGGNVPSRGVSGDFYQAIERQTEGDREVVLVIADVSGKGMAASLLTASLEALLAGPIESGRPPEEIVGRVSRLLHRRTPPEKYATLFLAAVEVASGRVRYTCAGHNPALVLRAGGEVDRLAATGPPVGLLPVAAYRPAEIVLAPGDTLVLYTDGFVEAADPDDEEYGIDRLIAACRAHAAEPPEELAAAVEEDVDGFVRGVPYLDDRTLVIAQRDAAPAA